MIEWLSQPERNRLKPSVFDRTVPASMTIRSRPAEPHVAVVSFDAGCLSIPGMVEPVCAFTTPNTFLLGVFVMDAMGQASTSFTIQGGNDLVGLPLWFQSFGVDPAQIVVGPLSGVPIR